MQFYITFSTMKFIQFIFNQLTDFFKFIFMSCKFAALNNILLYLQNLKIQMKNFMLLLLLIVQSFQVVIQYQDGRFVVKSSENRTNTLTTLKPNQFIPQVPQQSYIPSIPTSSSSFNNLNDWKNNRQTRSSGSYFGATILKQTPKNRTDRSSQKQNQPPLVQLPALPIPPPNVYIPITLSYNLYLRIYKPVQYRRMTQSPNFIQIYEYRQEIYYRNLFLINQYNKNLSKSFTKGLNSLTDLTNEQFQKIYKIPQSVIKQQAVKINDLITQQQQKNLFIDNTQNTMRGSISTTTTSASGSSSGSGNLFAPTTNPNSFFAKNPDQSQQLTLTPSPSPSPSISGRQQFNANIRSSSQPSISYKLPRPESIDWRQYSGYSYAQQECNACYAFSALETIQITLRVRNITNTKFSTQEILSCARDNITLLGCQGGIVADVYFYIAEKGVGPENYYPFEEDAKYFGEQFDCDEEIVYDPIYISKKYFIKSFRRIDPGNCQQIVELLFNKTIVSANIYSKQLQFYSQGILRVKDGQEVDPSKVDHQVTIVGYDHINETYIVKNSWGNKWGINGHAYVTRETGICIFGVYPILKN